MKHSRHRHIFNHAGVGFVAIALFGLIGLHFHGFSLAATYSNNPNGYADYCVLEGSNTVLYGWVYDPDAPAGAQPYITLNVGGAGVTVASDIAGYRDAGVNQWIREVYGADAPLTGTYGWRLQMSNLYKGGTYAVSGTINNYGAGANGALSINNGNNVSGDSVNKPFFTNSKIPDACLTTRPVAVSPAPAAPTPTVVKKPTPKVATPAAPVAPAAPTLSSDADATATSGTTIASLSIPTGNATSLYVRYGTTADKLDRSSEIQTVSDTTTTINLTGLKGKTTYNYQILRTLGAQTTTSANATFTTKPYSISLLFTDAAGKPLAGIVAQNGKIKDTSDKTGTVSFTNLASGTYQVSFTYQGKNYSQSFTTTSASKETGTNGYVLSKTINVARLATSATTPVKKKTSSVAAVLIALLVFVSLLVGVGWWFWLQRRKHHKGPFPASTSTDYLAHTAPAATYAVPRPVAHSQEAPIRHNKHEQALPPPTPQPTHMGESLRDMVILSMAEEAAKHPQDDSKRPIVPGQR